MHSVGDASQSALAMSGAILVLSLAGQGFFARGENSNGALVNQLPDTRYSKSVLAVLV
jgi:hypothetical protein